MSSVVCKKCASPLFGDEIALYRRLVDRGAVRFLCLGCMAEYFGVSESLLREKVAVFRKEGCTMFGKEPDLPPENP